MNLLPYGPRAVLAEFESLDDVMAATAEWSRPGLRGVREIVPAARTVLVVHDDGFDRSSLRPPTAAAVDLAGPTVVVPVRYDGADLGWVAAQIGRSVDEVVELHSSASHRCAFCGFMPGFSYLVGLPAELHLPRRATPRTRVPAGAVAIASEFSAVYPNVSPGGWHLIGSTAMPMWDDTRDPAATIPPGTLVRFEPT